MVQPIEGGESVYEYTSAIARESAEQYAVRGLANTKRKETKGKQRKDAKSIVDEENKYGDKRTSFNASWAALPECETLVWNTAHGTIDLSFNRDTATSKRTEPPKWGFLS